MLKHIGNTPMIKISYRNGKNVNSVYTKLESYNLTGSIKDRAAFYMIDKSRARKEGGAGIGMSLCKKIVSIHNAKWSVRSKPGKGTIISIVFQEGQN